MLSMSDDANLTSGNAPRLGFAAVGSSGLFRHTDLTAAYVGPEDAGISCCLQQAIALASLCHEAIVTGVV